MVDSYQNVVQESIFWWTPTHCSTVVLIVVSDPIDQVLHTCGGKTQKPNWGDCRYHCSNANAVSQKTTQGNFKACLIQCQKHFKIMLRLVLYQWSTISFAPTLVVHHMICSYTSSGESICCVPWVGVHLLLHWGSTKMTCFCSYTIFPTIFA